jgi:endonuclease/exonuclease/phosphatase family metal-dependent hydrolase
MRGVRRLVAIVLAVAAVAACRVPPMQVTPATPSCRVASASHPLRWVAPDDAVERRLLMSWCETVGPPAFYRRQAAPPAGATLLVTWNVHAGAGDIRALLADVRAREAAAGREEPNVILLLQEAIRSGGAPARVPGGSAMPDRIENRRSPVPDVIDVARLEDMNAVYVPSMRNGAEGANGRGGTAEDRGNAILSTEPLSDIAAIELPLSAQRRVALTARAGAGTGLQVVSLHLDTSGGQGRQASALLDALSALGIRGPVVVGGDFNSAMRRNAVIRRAALELHRAPCRGVTHRVFQLDHVMASDPDMVGECLRLDQFGSDHTPLLVRLR